MRFASQVNIKDVKAGDYVRVADGKVVVDESTGQKRISNFARVDCVVKINRAAGKNLISMRAPTSSDALSAGVLEITPKHPVMWSNPTRPEELQKWMLPKDAFVEGNSTFVEELEQEEDHFVYNLLLEEGRHTPVVGGV